MNSDENTIFLELQAYCNQLDLVFTDQIPSIKVPVDKKCNWHHKFMMGSLLWCVYSSPLQEWMWAKSSVPNLTTFCTNEPDFKEQDCWKARGFP